jgi:CheY-like chemotaxis protein
MGSTVQVNSEAGVGSTFFFTLWLEEGVKEQEGADYNSYSAQDEDLRSAPLHILVIDDNELNRRVLKGFLEKDGHSCVLCESAEDGLAYCGREKFDTIITDVRLGGMDGMEFTQNLREFADKSVAATPVIALSGNVSAEDQIMFRQAGMDAFLAKPIDPKALQMALRDLKHHMPAAAQNVSVHYESQADDEFDSFAFADESLEDEAVLHEDATPTHAYKGLNPTMLQGLAEALPKEQMRELVQSCLDKNEELVDALKDGLMRADANFLRERAHELKGMSANFGLTEMSAIGGLIEKFTKDGDVESARPEIFKLADAHRQSKEEIQHWLESL